MKTRQIIILLTVLFFSIPSFSQLKVLDNGNVGIGTNTPSCKLTVMGRGYYRVGNNVITVYPDNPGTEIGSSTDIIDFWYTNTGFNKLNAQSYTVISDSTMKSKIVPLTNSMSTIKKIKGYSYIFKDDKDPNKTQYGFISQEIKEILPEITTESKGLLLIDYNQITPFLLEAVKELQLQIDSLRNIIKMQDIKIDEFQKGTTENTEIGIDQGYQKSKLFDNVPNPFKNETTIQYYIEESFNNAYLTIYDMQGRVRPESGGQFHRSIQNDQKNIKLKYAVYEFKKGNK